VIVVLANTLSFRLDADNGTAMFWGDIDRNVLIPGEDCDDHKISPLSLYGPETAYDIEAGTVSGEFSYRVAAERFEVIGVPCEGANSRFGRGSGTWEATYDPDAGSLSGTLTFPGGLGVATFDTKDPNDG